MNQIILSLIENKMYLLVGAALTFTVTISYKAGLNNGFVPYEILCADDIKYLNQCQDDLKESHLLCTEELIKCKSSCKIDVCKDLCIEQSKKAVSDYKELMKVIECK